MDESDFTSSHILIAGLGLIGGSAAKALRAAGFAYIDAYDTDLRPLAQAKKDGVIRAGYTSLQAGEYDLVLCCLPPCDVAAFYGQVKPRIRPGGVFAEMGGLKKAMSERIVPMLSLEHELLCLHPMAGSERSGYAHSDAAIFTGAPLILTPTEKTGSNALAWAMVLKDTFGCGDMPTMTPDRHDEIIAAVSHLPHIAALAVHAAAAGNERFAGGSYRSVTRVADIHAALWAGLLTDNAEYVEKSIERFRKALDTLQRAVESRDAAALQKLLEDMSVKGEKV
jgi:prephenate dehydrogenase